MKSGHFFPDASLAMFKAPKGRGRPPTDLVDRMRAKAWYWFLLNQTQSRSATQLGQLFDVEDTNLFRKYRQGQSVPEKYVKMAERLVPGSTAILRKGPCGLFDAMTGNADDCWGLIEQRPAWYDHANRRVPLDDAMGWICRKVDQDMTQGHPIDLADFVALVALFRIHHEVSQWVLLKEEGAFERIAQVMVTDGPVPTSLNALGLTQDLKAWLVQKQLDRLRRDPRWQMQLSEWKAAHGGDGVAAYLAEPWVYPRR